MGDKQMAKREREAVWARLEALTGELERLKAKGVRPVGELRDVLEGLRSLLLKDQV